MSDAFAVTNRTRVVRLPDRGRYDRATILPILDEAFLCHVAFNVQGQPYAVPMAFGRDDDYLYLHASSVSRMARGAAGGIDVCVTVTHLDGLVLARSAFHHSMNHRSVMVIGRARLVTDSAERTHALRAIVDHMLPGRWDEVRAPDERELKATAVLAVPLEEVSAKVRTGPPLDDEDDYALPVWAGVVPVVVAAGKPQEDPRLAGDIGPLDVRRLTMRSRRADVASR